MSCDLPQWRLWFKIWSACLEHNLGTLFPQFFTTDFFWGFSEPRGMDSRELGAYLKGSVESSRVSLGTQPPNIVPSISSDPLPLSSGKTIKSHLHISTHLQLCTSVETAV